MDRDKIFSNAINKYFNFLFDYGFSVYEKEEYSTAFGNGYYRFKSNITGIEIVLDRGQVLMVIGKILQERRDWLEWSLILKVYAPNIKPYDFEISVESQVKRISELLQQYCVTLLSGDFSDERLIAGIEDERGKQFLKRFLER